VDESKRVQAYLGAPEHLQKPVTPASSAQERCDAIQAQFRSGTGERRSIRRDPPARPKALTPTDDVLRQRLAEELDYARRMLDLMGDELSADPIVVGRHMTALQTVDIAGQILGHIAAVIRSSDPEGAVDGIGMCDLKGRLQRRQSAL
jgi:hypothetical protein